MALGRPSSTSLSSGTGQRYDETKRCASIESPYLFLCGKNARVRVGNHSGRCIAVVLIFIDRGYKRHTARELARERERSRATKTSGNLFGIRQTTILGTPIFGPCCSRQQPPQQGSSSSSSISTEIEAFTETQAEEAKQAVSGRVRACRC